MIDERDMKVLYTRRKNSRTLITETTKLIMYEYPIVPAGVAKPAGDSINEY